MPHMMIRHKVADFGKWKSAYDDHRPTREALGLKDLHLWRSAEDPNEVFIVFAAADLAKAREFAASPDLKAKMQEAGVQGAPHMAFLTEA